MYSSLENHNTEPQKRKKTSCLQRKMEEGNICLSMQEHCKNRYSQGQSEENVLAFDVMLETAARLVESQNRLTLCRLSTNHIAVSCVNLGAKMFPTVLAYR